MAIALSAWLVRPRAQFMILIALALLIRIAAAVWLPNVHHPDEIFQALEPANRLATGSGIVTWEWREGIRSWLLPGLISWLMMSVGLFTNSRAAVLLAISATMALLSLSVVVVGYLVGKRHHEHHGGLLVGALCAVWPDLVYFAPKTLTEVVAAHILVIAAFLASKVEGSKDGAPGKRFAVLGLLLGLTFCLRFHLAFALLAVAIWACRTEWRQRWLPMIGGAAVPILVTGLIDTALWGTPFQSIWKNFWVNVVEGRSVHYGTSPFYWYFTAAVHNWRLAFIPIAILFVFGARRAPLFTLCAVLIWFSHMMLAHKELRFIYPATPFIIIVAGLGLLRVLAPLTKDRKFSAPVALAAAATYSVIALAVALGPGFRANWTAGGNMLAVQAAVRQEPELCGLGIVAVEWWRTGGYAHLGREIPIYLYLQPREGRPSSGPELGAAAFSTFNYAIAPAQLSLGTPFEVKGCWDGLCLHRRQGGCVAGGAGGASEANRHLIATDQ